MYFIASERLAYRGAEEFPPRWLSFELGYRGGITSDHRTIGLAFNLALCLLVVVAFFELGGSEHWHLGDEWMSGRLVSLDILGVSVKTYDLSWWLCSFRVWSIHTCSIVACFVLLPSLTPAAWMSRPAGAFP